MKPLFYSTLLSVLGFLVAKTPKASFVTVNCAYRTEKLPWSLTLIYTCTGKETVITSADTYIADFRGEHGTRRTNNDVVAVQFKNQQVTYIPKLLKMPYDNWEGLSIESSGLTYIDQSSFADKVFLKFLNLADNKVEEIPRKTFYDMTNLERINLDFNKLRTLNDDLLRKLPKLVYFSAANNQLEVLGSSLFRDNTNLRTINFANNNLRTIGWKLVRLNTLLSLATFAGNSCTDISANNEDENISDNLTQEFSQNCAVNCQKASQSAGERTGKLYAESQKLNETMSRNRMEKQQIRMNCNDQDY